MLYYRSASKQVTVMANFLKKYVNKVDSIFGIYYNRTAQREILPS